MFNKVVLVGNLGADPETRTTSGGSVVATLRLATQRAVKRDDKWEQETEWHKVVVFGQPAEFVGRYGKKGRLALVEGRIQTRKWEDRDGNTKWSTEVVADQVKLLGPNPDSDTKADDRKGYAQDAADDDIPF